MSVTLKKKEELPEGRKVKGLTIAAE